MYGFLDRDCFVRHWAIKCVEWKRFDQFVMLLIMVNSIWMARYADPVHDKMLYHEDWEDIPRLEAYAKRKEMVDAVDTAFLSAFTVASFR